MNAVTTITEEHAPRIVQNGATGIEAIILTRSGPGVAVWQVETSCKRNDSFVSYRGGKASVTYVPQESEAEYLSPNYMAEAPEYPTEVEIDLPTQDKTDMWVVETVYDKYGGWIFAFLLPTLAEAMSPEQIKVLRGES